MGPLYHRITGVGIVQDPGGLCGLEALGSDSDVTSEIDWNHPFGDASAAWSSRPFCVRVLAPTYERIEELDRAEYDFLFRVTSKAKVGLLAVHVKRTNRPGGSYKDQAEHLVVLPPTYERLVRIVKPARPGERGAWQSIVIGVSRGVFGRRFAAFVCPEYRNKLTAVPLASAGSFDGIAQQLAKKAGVPEASLREARAALEAVG
jgi:hypothetical protein